MMDLLLFFTVDFDQRLSLTTLSSSFARTASSSSFCFAIMAAPFLDKDIFLGILSYTFFQTGLLISNGPWPSTRSRFLKVALVGGRLFCLASFSMNFDLVYGYSGWRESLRS